MLKPTRLITAVFGAILIITFAVAATTISKSRGSHLSQLGSTLQIMQKTLAEGTRYTVQYLNARHQPAPPPFTQWLRITDNRSAVGGIMLFKAGNSTKTIQNPGFMHAFLSRANGGKFHFTVTNHHVGQRDATITVTDLSLHQTKTTSYRFQTGPAKYALPSGTNCDQFGCGGGEYDVEIGQTVPINIPIQVADQWQNPVSGNYTVDVKAHGLYSGCPNAAIAGSSAWTSSHPYLMPIKGGRGTLAITFTGIQGDICNIYTSLTGHSAVADYYILPVSPANYVTGFGWGTSIDQANLEQTATLPKTMHVGESLGEALFHLNDPLFLIEENAQGQALSPHKVDYSYSETSSNPSVITISRRNYFAVYAIAKKPGKATIIIRSNIDAAQPTLKQTITVLPK